MKKLKCWLIIMPAIFLLCGCEPSYIPANHFLVDDEPEQFGYGLYSYLIFSSQQNDSLKNRTLLSSFLSKRKELIEISKFKVDSDINIIYLPVKTGLPDNFENYSLERQTNWVLKNYSFERARELMRKFSFERSPGLCILSFHEPVSIETDVIKDNFLVQDFSHVPPSVGAMWIDEFIKQSYQNGYRNGANLKVFGDSLKNAVGSVSEKDKLNKATLGLEENLEKWITFR